MIVILSTSQPTVSATFPAPGLFRDGLPGRCALFPGDGLAHFLVDALDQVVALLIQLVDGALCRSDLQVIRNSCFVFLVPELDVRHRETRDELSNGVRHGGTI